MGPTPRFTGRHEWFHPPLLCIFSAEVNTVAKANHYYEERFGLCRPPENHCWEASVGSIPSDGHKTLPRAWHTAFTREPQCLLLCLWRRGGKESPYLSEIEDVSVRNCEEGIDCPTEGVDLLVRVPHKDLPTRLRQNYVHDSCNQ